MQNDCIYEKENSRNKRKEKKQRYFTGFLIRVLNCIASVILVTFLVAGIAYNVLSWFGVLIILAFFLPHMVCYFVIPLFPGKKQPSRLYKTIALLMWTLLFVFMTVQVLRPDNDTWRTYSFEAELAALEEELATPDAENAATLYEPILANIDLDTIKRKILDDCKLSPATYTLKKSNDPEIPVWADGHAETVQNLMKACQMEHCHFPILPEPFADICPELDERYNKFKICTTLLCSTAEQDFSNGRMEAGLEKCLCVIHMARHYSQHSTIMSFVDSFWIERYALSTIHKFIMRKDPTDANLRLIADSIDIENNWKRDWSQILEVDKLRIKNLCGAFYEVNSRGKLRFRRRFHTNFPENSLCSNPLVNCRRKIGDRLAPFGLALIVPYRPEATGKVIDDIYEKYFSVTSRDFNWHSLNECEQYRLKQMRRLHGMRFFLQDAPYLNNVTSLSLFHDLYMLCLAKRREFHIVTGLLLYKKKYGHWPTALEDIESLVSAKAFVDPINRGSFGYELVNDTFKIYRKYRNSSEKNKSKSNVPGHPALSDWLT